MYTKQQGIFGMWAIIVLASCLTVNLYGVSGNIRIVARPQSRAKNSFYTSNRKPLQPSALIKLPIGSIKPEGWLHKQLRLQADGFHGHLTEISGFLKKQGNAWLSPTGEGDHGWEEVPYWLKGYSNCAYVLGDKRMLAETMIWINGALNSQKSDGWFGPDKGRGGAATRLKGREDLWPNTIMLFCLKDYYDYSHDKRVIPFMKRYFRYLMQVPEDKFLVGYWPKMRGGDLLYCVLWLYNRTGDEWLLDLARKVHRHTAKWSRDVINWHNVNMSQAFGEGATYFEVSGKPEDLASAERNYKKIRNLFGQVPGGMFGGDENCRPGYTGPRQAIETCGIVEMMLSQETLIRISGDLHWADRCEDVAFNTLPAAVTADMKALRYLTSPNMVQSDKGNKSPGLQNGGSMLLMTPWAHRCCQHNWGHGWPYFSENLWMATPDNGLAAVLYAANTVTARVGGGTEVTIHETTHYPFEETINFSVSPVRSGIFPLYLKIPGWCQNPSLKINGQNIPIAAKPFNFIRIERKWHKGDTVALALPMEIRLRTWKKNHNSVSVDRGPLTYSLKIGERYVRAGGTDKWPAWEIFPSTPWNYGLVLDKHQPTHSFTVVRKAWPANDMPFTQAGCPIEIRAKGKRIPEWQLDKLGLCMEIQDSPVKSDMPTEDITLIPMGAARLRISAFPVIGDGPEAHKWTGP